MGATAINGGRAFRTSPSTAARSFAVLCPARNAFSGAIIPCASNTYSRSNLAATFRILQ